MYVLVLLMCCVVSCVCIYICMYTLYADCTLSLSLLQVFEYALTYTAGEDLSKILWLKSENSESWLQRRATYTRSLAVMSMVVYVLGLGDRHPSNLMLDRKTGKVLHIDFGDCFEVAMQREKFPEKVPFRLTRMLANAMEVAGIEGNYRSTCKKTETAWSPLWRPLCTTCFLSPGAC